MEDTKRLFVRISPDLHRKVKIQAYHEGMSMQEWITTELTKLFAYKEKIYEKACSKCGKWELTNGMVAELGTCAVCGKNETLIRRK